MDTRTKSTGDAISGSAWRAPGLRAFYQQARIVGSVIGHRYFIDQKKYCDRSHLEREWNFSAPAEQQRYARVVAAVDAARGGRDWGTVLELGCSEGLFTSQIAPHCTRLDAVDLSTVACARASERCAALRNVTVRNGRIGDARPAASYDVILAMCVWEYLQGRDRHVAAARRVIRALRPGGLLVLNATRLPEAYEGRWWARALCVGAAEIVRLLADQDALRLIGSESSPSHTTAVFTKAEIAGGPRPRTPVRSAP